MVAVVLSFAFLLAVVWALAERERRKGAQAERDLAVSQRDWSDQLLARNRQIVAGMRDGIRAVEAAHEQYRTGAVPPESRRG